MLAVTHLRAFGHTADSFLHVYTGSAPFESEHGSASSQLVRTTLGGMLQARVLHSAPSGTVLPHDSGLTGASGLTMGSEDTRDSQPHASLPANLSLFSHANQGFAGKMAADARATAAHHVSSGLSAAGPTQAAKHDAVQPAAGQTHAKGMSRQPSIKGSGSAGHTAVDDGAVCVAYTKAPVAQQLHANSLTEATPDNNSAKTGAAVHQADDMVFVCADANTCIKIQT